MKASVVFGTLCGLALALAWGFVINLGTADAAPGLQLPWPSGHKHRIYGGYTYGCGTHDRHTATSPTAYNADYYAIDVQFGPVDGSPLDVSAVAAGTVVVREFEVGWGNKVVVDHGSGYYSVYAHFREPNPWGPGIAVGVKVAQGRLLGYAGNTGGNYAVHLHFHMQRNLAAFKAEPMSGVRGFGNYGFSREDGTCDYDGDSPYWISRHPYDPQQVSATNSGDSRGDAVVFYQGTGQWFVAPSTGSSFGAHSQWITGHGVGSNRQLMADVNHDFRTDSVVYFGSDGSWWVARSTGSGYSAPSRWIQGHGINSSNQFLADVNQDGKADAVVYFQQDGSWYVALSTGSGFSSFTRWATGHGIGSSDQLLADATGDLRADAIVFFPDGSWYVAPSTGSGFGAFSLWTTGHGYGSDRRFVADVNGDLRADAVVYFGGNGDWYVARSTGSGFQSFTRWATGHGIGSDNQMLVDATGDNKADATVYFGQSSGAWYVAPSTGSGFTVPGPCCPWKTGFGVDS